MNVFKGGKVVTLTSEEERARAKAMEAETFPEPPINEEAQAILFVRSVASKSTTLTDTVALSIPDLLMTWDEALESGQTLNVNQCLNHHGQLYRVVQAVTPQAHQVPGGDGMLAIYRPIDRNHKGTLTDPIPWVNGMDCCAGMYYSYHEAVYLCNGDMKPCVWAPDTAGLWQWSKMEGE